VRIKIAIIGLALCVAVFMGQTCTPTPTPATTTPTAATGGHMSFQLTNKAQTTILTGTLNSFAGALIVPTGEIWEIQSVFVRITASAVVGNRLIEVAFGAIALGIPVIITASQVAHITLLQGLSSVIITTPAANDRWYQVPFGRFAVIGGLTDTSWIFISDAFAIDPAVDQGTLVFVYDQYRFLPDIVPVVVAPASVVNPNA